MDRQDKMTGATADAASEYTASEYTKSSSPISGSSVSTALTAENDGESSIHTSSTSNSSFNSLSAMKSPDDLMQKIDDYEPTPGKANRRTRTILTPYQSKVLKRVLDQTLFPSTELRNSLATMLGVKPRTIQIWFQNQRQKAKHRIESGGEVSDADSSKQSPRQVQPRQELRWVPLVNHSFPSHSPPLLSQSPLMSPPIYTPAQVVPKQPKQHQFQQYQVSPQQRPIVSPVDQPRGGLDILASIASITTVTSTDLHSPTDTAPRPRPHDSLKWKK